VRCNKTLDNTVFFRYVHAVSVAPAPPVSSQNFSRQTKLLLTRRIHLTIVLSALLWCLGFILAPLLLSGGWLHEFAGGRLVSFYGHICHQIESRSVALAGVPVAVCSRCMGVYLAFLAGALVAGHPLAAGMSARIGRELMILALVPMLADVLAGHIGLYEPGVVTRVMTGSWFGFLAAVSLVPVAVGAASELIRWPRSERENPVAG